MNRLKLLIACLFVVALGTGILVGMGLARSAAHAVVKNSTTNPRTSLSEALNLTAAQNEQLKTIWTDWDPTRQSRFDHWHQFQKDRDDSVQSLLTDSQKSAYDDIQKKYRQELDQIDEERKQAFQAAVDKTKSILSDAQRAKYDEILKNGSPGGGHGNHGFDHGGDRGHGPSTHHGPGMTQPAAQSDHQV